MDTRQTCVRGVKRYETEKRMHKTDSEKMDDDMQMEVALGEGVKRCRGQHDTQAGTRDLGKLDEAVVAARWWAVATISEAAAIPGPMPGPISQAATVTVPATPIGPAIARPVGPAIAGPVAVAVTAAIPGPITAAIPGSVASSAGTISLAARTRVTCTIVRY